MKKILSFTPLFFIITSLSIIIISCKTPPAANNNCKEDSLRTVIATMSQTPVMPDAFTGFRRSLGKLDMVMQKQVFIGLTPELKCALWRNRLSEVLKQPFNEDQKKLLSQALTMLSPAVYTKGKDNEQFMAFLKEWDAGVHEKFKGNDSVNIHHWLTSFDDRMDTSKNFAGYTSPPLPKCNCRVESDWCGIGMACIREKCDVGFPMGCGWFSLFPCDGICDWPWKRKPEPGATAASNTAPSPH